MARLPDTYAKRPSPRFGTPDQANPAIRSGDEAIAQGVADLGNAMERAKLSHDNAMVDDAYTKAKAAALDHAKGEQGYEHDRGEQVVKNAQGPANRHTGGYFEEKVSQFDVAVDEIASSLSSGYQSEQFRRKIDVLRLGVQENLIDHVTRQTEEFEQQSSINGKIMAIETAKENWDSPWVIKQQVDEANDFVNKDAERMGYSPEQTAVERMRVLSSLHASVITSAVDAENADYAQAYFDGIDKETELTASHESKLVALLESAGKDERIQGMVDEVYDTYRDDRAGGANKIREMARPGDRKEALRLFNNRLAEDNNNKIDEYVASGERARNIFAEGMLPKEQGGWGFSATEAFANIPPSVLQDMKPAELMSLMARRDQLIAEKPAVGGLANYLELKRLWEDHGDDPGVQKIFDNLGMLEGSMKESFILKLDAMRTKDPQDLKNEKYYEDVALVNAGLERKNLLEEGDAGVRARKLMDTIYDNLPRNHTREDFKNVSEAASAQILVDEDIIFDDYEPAFEVEIPGVELGEVGNIVPVLEDLEYPTSVKNIQTGAAILQSGRPLTKENFEAMEGVDLESGSGTFSFPLQQNAAPGEKKAAKAVRNWIREIWHGAAGSRAKSGVPGPAYEGSSQDFPGR